MNEQIRQLVRQAGLDDADFPIEDWDNVPLAKFAQLIVKACAEFRNELGVALCTDPGALYRHFGVEE